jgi:hypothetical protein
MKKWLAILSFITLIISCFLPWSQIPSRDLVITGMAAEAINFGKPGYFHILLSVIIIAFTFIQKVWSVRAAFFVAAFNIAWSVRNFILFAACSGGVCPTRLFGLYLMLASSILGTILILGVDKSADSQ